MAVRSSAGSARQRSEEREGGIGSPFEMDGSRLVVAGERSAARRRGMPLHETRGSVGRRRKAELGLVCDSEE